jgi:hypothetical protein
MINLTKEYDRGFAHGCYFSAFLSALLLFFVWKGWP